MIRENEVAIWLSTEVPGLHKALTNLNDTLNLYKSVQCFADYTVELIKDNNPYLVKKCFSVAEQMLLDGTGQVKTAVENVYVYTVGSLIGFLPDSRNKIKEFMTPKLLIIYQRHLRAGGL